MAWYEEPDGSLTWLTEGGQRTTHVPPERAAAMKAKWAEEDARGEPQRLVAPPLNVDEYGLPKSRSGPTESERARLELWERERDIERREHERTIHAQDRAARAAAGFRDR